MTFASAKEGEPQNPQPKKSGHPERSEAEPNSVEGPLTPRISADARNSPRAQMHHASPVVKFFAANKKSAPQRATTKSGLAKC